MSDRCIPEPHANTIGPVALGGATGMAYIQQIDFEAQHPATGAGSRRTSRRDRAT